MSHLLVVNFILIGEGSSDEALRQHLELLCVEAGADEVRGVVPDFARLHYNRALHNRLRAARDLEPSANLFFIHHDADNSDPTNAYSFIKQAVQDSEHKAPFVALVPIHETEAWLLLNEQTIRNVVSRSSGKVPLNLPPPHRIEYTAQPKEKLQAALVAAAEVQGRRLELLKANFLTHRRLLLERLPVGGPLEQLSAWRRLRDDTAAAIAMLRTVQTTIENSNI